MQGNRREELAEGQEELRGKEDLDFPVVGAPEEGLGTRA